MLFGKKELAFLSPVSGNVVPLEKIPDEAFSSGMLGVGFGISPASGAILSPVSGRIESVAEAKHAYTLLTEEGLDVLVHIGVDTVSLGGVGFSPLVKAGDRVCAGDPICRADIEWIRKKGLPDVVVVLITNPERIENTEYTYGECMAGKERVMRFRLRK